MLGFLKVGDWCREKLDFSLYNMLQMFYNGYLMHYSVVLLTYAASKPPKTDWCSEELLFLFTMPVSLKIDHLKGKKPINAKLISHASNFI